MVDDKKLSEEDLKDVAGGMMPPPSEMMPKIRYRIMICTNCGESVRTISTSDTCPYCGCKGHFRVP